MTSTEPSSVRGESSDLEWSWTSEGADWVPPVLEPTKVSAARVYDYLLGGKDNFEADRAVAGQMLQVTPFAREVARGNRAFLVRAVRHLVRDCGIRQIIDLGTGLPTSPSVHEIAGEYAPDVRVVYIDNDPVVAAHNSAVLGTEPNIVTLLRDLREPDTVLDDPSVRALIDFAQPVGLLFVAVLHFVAIDHAPVLLARYREAVSPGSGLAISALCRDVSEPEALEVAEDLYAASSSPLVPRTRAQVEQLFDGFQLRVPPAPVFEWGLEPGDPPPAEGLPTAGIGGVAVKG